MKEAVVLLSGGIDSVTAMAIAMHEGYAVHALSFNYSQRHTIEIEKARDIASAMGVKKHLVLDINLEGIGGSALTDSIAVPKDREAADMLGAFLLPMCRRETPSSSPAPSRGQKRWASLIFLLAFMPRTTAVILIAGLSISRHLNRWQILLSRQRSRAKDGCASMHRFCISQRQKSSGAALPLALIFR